MKLLVIAVCVLLLPACTLDQKTYTEAGKVGINLAQEAADAAVKIILEKAKSKNELTTQTGLLYSAAAGLRTLESSSGGVLTADQIVHTVRGFTDPNQVQWTVYAEKLATSFTQSSAKTDTKLEQLAVGIESAALEAQP